MSKLDELRQQSEEADRKVQEIITKQVSGEPTVTPEPPPVVVEPPPVVTPESKPTEDPNSQTWEHRFKTLQGIHKADVKREVDQAIQFQQGQNAMLQSQIQALQAQISAMSAAAPATTATTVKQDRAVTDEFRKDFEDVGDTMGKVEDRAMAAEMAAKEAQQQAAESRKATAALQWERCVERLTGLVPDWETVNASPEFVAYCNEADPVTGERRQKALDVAIGMVSAPRMAAFFNQFKSTQSVVPPVVETPPPVRPKPDVSPSSSRSNPPANKPGKVWKQSEVAAFYTEAVKAKSFSTPEYSRINAEIEKAQAEGRVAPG